jgi:glutamate carboxypeptidase
MSSTLAGLTEWIRTHRDDIVADIVDLVSIETPSDDKALLAAGLERIERWIHARLGDADAREMHDGGEYGDILVLDYGSSVPTDRTIAALCHYDTVWDAGTLAEWPATVDGDRLTGPGAFDMKTGLVQLVWALRAVAALDLPRPHVRLLLNGDEEIGSIGSRPVIEEVARSATEVLVFEASADGAVKTARKGAGMFRVEVLGKEAHAGLDPEHGVSAIDELSRIVLQLHSATDLERGTTINVGLMSGGTRVNVKAGRASAKVDVRVSSEAEAARVDDLLRNLQPANSTAKISISGGWNRPVMQRSDSVVALYGVAAEVASDLGFELSERSVGGYSDGNLAAALDRPVLDGLGAIGGGAHARDEWVSIDGTMRQIALTAGLLGRLSERDVPVPVP